MLHKAIESLEKTRDMLLQEQVAAGGRGDWPLARKLMDLAEEADRLRVGVQNLTASAPAIVEPAPAAPQAAAPAPVASEGEEYPRFLVRDDLLVKCGRQRDGSSEYEHTVPKDRFEHILRIIGDLAVGARNAPNRPFRFEAIQDQVEYPQYQARVVVSLLVRKGLLVMARKGSYRFRSPTTFASDAANLWNTMKGENE